MVDRCEFHADVLKREIENTGDKKLKSFHESKLLESIQNLKEDYMIKLRKEYSRGGISEI